MKNEVLYLLLNDYADHEPVFLASAIACDERCIKENPKYMNKVVAPTLDAVRSCSGFHTLPDYSFDTMPDDYAALVLIGGFGWFDEKEADKVVPIVRRAIEKGIIVGAICNAASFLALGTIAVVGWKPLYQCSEICQCTSRFRSPHCDCQRFGISGFCQRVATIIGK